MPDQGSTRYEEHDFPGFKAEMEKLCPDCEVIYQNANADVALQQQQFNSVITQGAKVVVLDPVDSKAAASLVNLAQSQGVKVIAYDRPIPDVPADYLRLLRQPGDRQGDRREPASRISKAEGVPTDTGGVLQINGSPTDAAAGLIRDGVHEASRPASTRRWPSSTRRTGSRPTPRSGRAARSPASASEIVGVVAANDGTGGGAIAAFKAAGVDPLPPVTGNDATTAALQLDHRRRPVQHHLQALGDRRRGGGRRRRSSSWPARRRSRRPRSTTRRPSSSCRWW